MGRFELKMEMGMGWDGMGWDGMNKECTVR